jgi:hypothetical protein
METQFNRAVVLLIGVFFIISAILIIICLWPDRMPGEDTATTYTINWFHVRLKQVGKERTDTVRDTSVLIGSSRRAKPDSIKNHRPKPPKSPVATVDLNSLLLILVACGGFLGNMVNLTSSFMSPTGKNKHETGGFYLVLVKPFIGAALALVVYFALRAGLLNSSSASSNVNIYGIMTAAVLTGLFTDIAMARLEKIYRKMLENAKKDDST